VEPVDSPPHDTTAFVGLGSNLQDPVDQVRRALIALAALPRTRLTEHSRLFRTPPLGPTGQPHYVNAVARLETRLAPLELLDRLQGIEVAQGRVRVERWGPRTLDLDLLLFGALRLDLERLTVPHAQLARRAFVLVPLAEVAPADLEVPGLGPLAALVARCDRGSILAQD
jgi:2-amino-4-hydroxy-6-hydroxymethyldihydropteridine diphosphokinase